LRGRDLVSGLPREIIVDDEMIRHAISRSIMTIVETIRVTMEESPPELVADIIDRGIMMAGGGALIRGLDRLISQHTKTKVYVTDDPLTTVARGTGVVLEDLDSLREVLLSSSQKTR